MLKNCFRNVRESCPLVHNITNYVTVNDCANILLACGASPIMADDKMEVEEITSICSGLNINIGTLNERTIESMVLAGKKANLLNHPVILDPVGVGASSLRTNTAKMLLDNVEFSVIRGNISEIKTLAIGQGNTKGVDASSLDSVCDKNMDEVILFAKEFALKTGAVIVITGAIDIIANKDKAVIVSNGVPMMADITGSGCMLTALLCAFISANVNNVFEAAVAGVCTMGLCGEKAAKTVVEKNLGNMSFRTHLIDEIYKLNEVELLKGCKYEVR